MTARVARLGTHVAVCGLRLRLLAGSLLRSDVDEQSNAQQRADNRGGDDERSNDTSTQLSNDAFGGITETIRPGIGKVSFAKRSVRIPRPSTETRCPHLSRCAPVMPTSLIGR
jgi:hypothetical protein